MIRRFGGMRGRTLALGIFALAALAGCEIDERISIHPDGSAEVLVRTAIEDQWAGTVIPELKQKLPPGWKVVEEKHEADRQILTIGRHLDQLSELSDQDQSFQLASRREGLFKKDYLLTLRQLRGASFPVPFKVHISMPGSLGATSGTKLSGSEVEFDLTGAQGGAGWAAASSAWALPDVAQVSAAIDSALERMPRFAGLSPTVLRTVVVATGTLLILSLLLALTLAVQKLVRRVASSRTPISAKDLCGACGAGLAAGAAFCTHCGARRA
jgi:hypothetical protein